MTKIEDRRGLARVLLPQSCLGIQGRPQPDSLPQERGKPFGAFLAVGTVLLLLVLALGLNVRAAERVDTLNCGLTRTWLPPIYKHDPRHVARPDQPDHGLAHLPGAGNEPERVGEISRPGAREAARPDAGQSQFRAGAIDEHGPRAVCVPDLARKRHAAGEPVQPKKTESTSKAIPNELIVRLKPGAKSTTSRGCWGRKWWAVSTA